MLLDTKSCQLDIPNNTGGSVTDLQDSLPTYSNAPKLPMSDISRQSLAAFIVFLNPTSEPLTVIDLFMIFPNLNFDAPVFYTNDICMNLCREISRRTIKNLKSDAVFRELCIPSSSIRSIFMVVAKPLLEH